MPQPIPIAFGITDLDVGGAEKMLVALATGLDRSRWNPSVVSLQPPGMLREPLERTGIPVDSLDLKSASDLPRAFWRWRQIMKQRQPALLQTFLIHANVLGRMAGRSAGVPKIVNGIRVADRRPGLIHWLDKQTATLADLHICASEGVRDFTMAKTKLRPERLRVIPNGIDAEPHQDSAVIDIRKRLQLPGDPGPAILLFIGRLDPQKGMLDLLDALRELNRQHAIARRLQVVILGEGPQRPILESRIEENGIHDLAHLVGWQPNPLAWLGGADGLILPSHWEGMPNVVLEAMSVGAPVIATDVEGTREIVRPNQTGWLVPPGQPVKLAEAIEEFLRSPQLREKYGSAGKSLVAEQYTIERMIQSYERCYLELL